MAFTERRDYERVPFTKKLMVMDASSGERFEARGIDISIKGIGFYSKKLFQKGSRISIQVWLDNALRIDPFWINAIVRDSGLEQDGAVMHAQFDTFIKVADHPVLYELICKQDFR